ncbi:alpha-1D adrenergic receptor-like [Scleropages formosus]|uniref:Alpha-1D adrenergic receptor-like n=1 Tax=Scleropages formosus TaxID=113540 RepID=A0A0P7VVB5_SCLFO|nr:5-hydroxytryptamine receptor 4-like [Scleropages formosus]KPP78063.1 alpha-1D adrenergic receptor-like [Scleropages formosus]
MDTAKWIESFIRALMCLLGILGNNWLAICSLPDRASRLRTNEALFLNLAASNLITNCLVDLPDTIADFANGWFWGKFYCKVFMFCAGLSETSSILSTLLISVFWYQKLVGSLRRGGAPVAMDNLHLVALLLAGGWVVAMAFSIPRMFFATLETQNQSRAECTDSFRSKRAKESYEITYVTLANAIPIAGIVFASIQIVVTLLQHEKRIQTMGSVPRPAAATSHPDGAEKPTVAIDPPARAGINIPAARPDKPTSNPSSQVRAAKSVVAVASVFLVCWMTHLLLHIYSNVSHVSVLVEIASYIAASYTSIIPYIFLYGVRKLSCPCCK